eukprot:scaffold1366_cov155-Skeletonema_menzelii.AAC.7
MASAAKSPPVACGFGWSGRTMRERFGHGVEVTHECHGHDRPISIENAVGTLDMHPWSDRHSEIGQLREVGVLSNASWTKRHFNTVSFTNMKFLRLHSRSQISSRQTAYIL